MPIEIRPLSAADRKFYSELVIGQGTCPCCGRTDVAVVNDNGQWGKRNLNYFENHRLPSSTQLCVGSEKMLKELET